jgi:hypothetical protein
MVFKLLVKTTAHMGTVNSVLRIYDLSGGK